MYSRLGVSTKIPSDMGPQQVIFSENRKTEKTDKNRYFNKIGI